MRRFARIHETNLKKQGILPLHLLDPTDYDKVREDDRVSILGLARLTPGSRSRWSSTTTTAPGRGLLRHTFNEEQIGWFRAGSALNVLRQKK